MKKRKVFSELRTQTASLLELRGERERGTMNNLGRGNWFLMIFILVGMMVFVGAALWDETANDGTYWTAEEILYTHNLSTNVINLTEGDVFSIAPGGGIYIYWNDVIVNLSDIEDWIFIENSSTGNLTINAIYDNQTGAFRLPLKVTEGADSATRTFNFTVNATNDIPNFTLDSDYNVSVLSSGDTTKNISLTGSDEESQYPLEYNVTFSNCSFASWSSRNNSNCSLNYDMINLSNTSSTLILSNLTYNDVGVYNLTICVHDNVNGTSLPAYYDSDYVENKSYCQNTTLNLLSSLSIDASDCNGTSWTEGGTLDCVINITTIGATDSIEVLSDASFATGGYIPYNDNWFVANGWRNATGDYLISIPISIVLNKTHVGNWVINFSANDYASGNFTRPIFEQISIFANWTESNVSLGAISDLNGSSALYKNYSFVINATDDDLLIRDRDVKDEELIFNSNTSWVDVEELEHSVGNNYIVANVSVDWNYVNATLDLGVGNYSVLINVTDGAGTSDYKVFTIEILNDTAPEWNLNESPHSLNLTEDVSFNYNVGVNVSDVDVDDTITFYYENISASFCSLNSSTFNSTSGIISFTPTDCDVGYHNVTIIAGDGKLNSSYEFNFTVANVVDVPVFESLEPSSPISTTEDNETIIDLEIRDDDFLIPDGQRSAFYDENLTISLTFNNSINNNSISFDFDFIIESDGIASYQANFTPNENNTGVYNVTINVTDAGNASNVSYFILNITDSNDVPNLTFIENQSWAINEIFYLDINATDEEDGNDSLGNLTYSLNFTLGDDFVNGNESIFNSTSGIFNLTLNSTYAGEYNINVSVNDTTGAVDWQIFSLKIYGTPNITLPSSDYVFNWSEANATGDLDFEVDYAVNNTELTYRFYLDKIVYSNATFFSYTTLISDDSLRNATSYSWTDNANYSWNWTPSYTDESYGMLKNFTLVVFNPDYPELNNSVNWKVNVTHTNQNVSFNSDITPIQNVGPISEGSFAIVDLNSHFSDADYWDKNINQVVNFSINHVAGNVSLVSMFSSVDEDWILTLTISSYDISSSITETISLTALEWDDSNVSIGNVTSNVFNVTFDPVTATVEVPVPQTRTSTRTVVKYYSLRIIVPRDIIISQQGFIDVPFSVQNDGQTDLRGISLDNFVRFNDEFSDDVRISIDGNYIEELKIGQSEDFNLRILANTQRAGRYKATIIANVTSPKFSDWADFFIEIEKANESEAEQILIFTEKLIVENPECLELTEVFRRAEDAFAIGDYSTAISLAQEAIEACEEAIEMHEQIRYKVEGAVKDNFYYILFATLALFFMGFIFYVYKRVRFNKSEADEYV